MEQCTCPHCGTAMSYSASDQSSQAVCPSCANSFWLPAKAQAPTIDTRPKQPSNTLADEVWRAADSIRSHLTMLFIWYWVIRFCLWLVDGFQRFNA